MWVEETISEPFNFLSPRQEPYPEAKEPVWGLGLLPKVSFLSIYSETGNTTTRWFHTQVSPVRAIPAPEIPFIKLTSHPCTLGGGAGVYEGAFVSMPIKSLCPMVHMVNYSWVNCYPWSRFYTESLSRKFIGECSQNQHLWKIKDTALKRRKV